MPFFNVCLLLALVFVASISTAENTDWAIYGNNYQNHRHTPLKQINRDTVKHLKLAWRYKTGKVGSFQTSPIVIDGVMYFSTAFNDVVALEADSGKEIWRYDHTLIPRKTCCGPANRGVAVAYGKVYQVTIDGRFLALNQKTGAVIWDQKISDVTVNLQESLSQAKAVAGDSLFGNAKRVGATGHSFNMAPQVYNGLIYVGSTGAGYGLHLNTDKGLQIIGQGDGRTGLRGFIVAFDANTGKEVWRWYSVPDANWIGQWREKTAGGVPLNRDIKKEKQQYKKFPHTWALGGGSIWTTPAIDTATGIMYVGTGNPAPNMEDSTRPGDNLHTSSIVALDSRTGELIWAFQQVPHDRWGYDVASPPVLFMAQVAGKLIPAVGQAGKTGWFYVLDRRNGRLLFKSQPFVPQKNIFADPTETGVTVSPGIDGGSNWSPVAVSPENEVFIAGVHLPVTYFRKKVTPTPNTPWESYSYFTLNHAEKYGLLSAIDLNTGLKMWQHKTPNPLIGGVLHTAGNLVFSGEGGGEFFALDSKTGDKLWSQKTAYGVNAPPMSYQVNGKQYIAVAAGGNKLHGYKLGDEVLVFALD